jgi:hypothetical protein
MKNVSNRWPYCMDLLKGVKPLRLVAQPSRALGLDHSARPSKEGCRDMNAGNLLEGAAFGKKVRKKRSWPPQKLLTRETSYKVFGRRQASRGAQRQDQRAAVRKPAKEGNRGRRQEARPQASSLWGFEGVRWWDARAARCERGFLQGR